MKNNNYDFLTNALGVAMTAVQTNEIFQLISLILTCISITFSMIFTIWKWYHNATADGKIDKNEFDDIMNETGAIINRIDNKLNDLNDKLNKKDKK